MDMLTPPENSNGDCRGPSHGARGRSRAAAPCTQTADASTLPNSCGNCRGNRGSNRHIVDVVPAAWRAAARTRRGRCDAARHCRARVDGRVATVPVARGQNVEAGAILVKIDNPETIAKHQQARAAKAVAEAQVANIRAEHNKREIAARKAALERAEANVELAQKTYDRVQPADAARQCAAGAPRSGHRHPASEPACRRPNQVGLQEEAVNGYTREEREIAAANVGKAEADIKAVQSIIDQLEIYAPVASQIYKRNIEPGESVAPGMPLVTLIDLSDMWIHFDLREDLVKTLKAGTASTCTSPPLPTAASLSRSS